MRSFLMLYSCDFESNDEGRQYMSGRSLQAERRAFSLLASVCSYWRLTLTGWPQSPTGHWVRHQLKKMIERECVRLRFTSLNFGWTESVKCQ